MLLEADGKARFLMVHSCISEARDKSAATYHLCMLARCRPLLVSITRKDGMEKLRECMAGSKAH